MAIEMGDGNKRKLSLKEILWSVFNFAIFGGLMVLNLFLAGLL